MRTVTSHDREALTLTHICKFKGQNVGQDEQEPLQTVTASAGECAEIRTEVRTYWESHSVVKLPRCQHPQADVRDKIGGSAYFQCQCLDADTEGALQRYGIPT